MIGVFRERFFTFRMKLKMFITSSDHYLKYLAILFLVKASGLGDFVSQNPLFSYGVLDPMSLAAALSASLSFFCFFAGGSSAFLYHLVSWEDSNKLSL